MDYPCDSERRALGSHGWHLLGSYSNAASKAWNLLKFTPLPASLVGCNDRDMAANWKTPAESKGESRGKWVAPPELNQRIVGDAFQPSSVGLHLVIPSSIHLQCPSERWHQDAENPMSSKNRWSGHPFAESMHFRADDAASLEGSPAIMPLIYKSNHCGFLAVATQTSMHLLNDGHAHSTIWKPFLVSKAVTSVYPDAECHNHMRSIEPTNGMTCPWV